MGDLYYTANMSLDGYTTDAQGNFDFSEPDAEVHQFFNDFERHFALTLYGRKMYETMLYWETNPENPTESAIAQEFAEVWRAQRKIVYSTTLDSVSTKRTTLERTFDPDAIRQLKRDEETDIGIGGPTIAAAALRAGLVDYVHLMILPHLLGGGLAAFPDDVRVPLQLVDQQRFASGTVRVLYRVLN